MSWCACELIGDGLTGDDGKRVKGVSIGSRRIDGRGRQGAGQGSGSRVGLTCLS